MPGVNEELKKILIALDSGTVSKIQLSRYQVVVDNILGKDPRNPFALYLKAKLLILSTKPQDRTRIKAEVLNLVNAMAALAHSATYYHRKWALLNDLNMQDDDVYQEQKKACLELLKLPDSPSSIIYHTIAQKFLFNTRNTIFEMEKSEIGDSESEWPSIVRDQDKAMNTSTKMKQEPTKNSVLISTRESSDYVHFSVAGPKTAKPGSNFLLTFWAYLNSDKDEVLKRIYDSHSRENTRIQYKGPVKLEREKQITLFIEIENLILKQNISSIYWIGEITSETFFVSVPDNVDIGTKIGKISLLVEGIEISTIHFSLEITNFLTQLTPVQSLPVDIRLPQSAFASYSKNDIMKVIARIQAMEIVAPWLKVYIDFDGIRAGQYWKDELKKSISDTDIFYLFWSENAALSDWVKREWLCALNSKGLDFIHPVPLVNPDKVPPPPELSAKQFKDKWLCYIEGIDPSRTTE